MTDQNITTTATKVERSVNFVNGKLSYDCLIASTKSFVHNFSNLTQEEKTEFKSLNTYIKLLDKCLSTLQNSEKIKRVQKVVSRTTTTTAKPRGKKVLTTNVTTPTDVLTVVPTDVLTVVTLAPTPTTDVKTVVTVAPSVVTPVVAVSKRGKSGKQTSVQLVKETVHELNVTKELSPTAKIVSEVQTATTLLTSTITKPIGLTAVDTTVDTTVETMVGTAVGTAVGTTVGTAVGTTVGTDTTSTVSNRRNKTSSKQVSTSETQDVEQGKKQKRAVGVKKATN